MKKPRILFVAMQASPHVSRWINMIADQGWDLHLFPVNAMPVLSDIKHVTVHQPWKSIGFPMKDEFSKAAAMTERAIYPIPMVRKFARIANIIKTSLGESGVKAPLLYGPRTLARLINDLKPDLIHSMEFQHCGYNVLQARDIVGAKNFPKWLATNWGSDIFYYRNHPSHNAQIRRLLAAIDYYNCECERDVSLAREMGMTAKVLPVKPNSGGFDLPAIEPLRHASRPSARRLIMVKGYQHFAGRALVALDALARVSEILKGYKIRVFSASKEILPRVDQLRASHKLDIEILPYAEHAEMLKLFAAARCYLGVSVSDAISTSMLEALAMGAFPIQTNTSCCDEWIEDGKTGFSIPPDDADIIADRIRLAMTGDELVDRAADLNWKMVAERLDATAMKRKVINDYRETLAAPLYRQ